MLVSFREYCQYYLVKLNAIIAVGAEENTRWGR